MLRNQQVGYKYILPGRLAQGARIKRRTCSPRAPRIHFLLSQLNPLGFFWLSAVSLAAAIAPKVVEPVCSDTPWKLIKVRRGGGRGHAQKCRLISEGLRGGQLIDQHPFILDEHYVNSWGGQGRSRSSQHLRFLRACF